MQVRYILQGSLPDAEEAARDLGGSETLRMLKQQVKHGGVHSEYAQQELYLMGRQMPYQPMGPRTPPAGDEQVAGMFKKLAARSSSSVSVSNETQSPQEKSEPSIWPAQRKDGLPLQPPRPSGKLEWAEREPGSMGRYSKCGWYSICQIRNGDEETFQSWTRNPLTQGMRILEIGLPTFKAAIAVCQKDADEHYARGDR